MNLRNVTALTALVALASKARWDIASQRWLPTDEPQNHSAADLARFLSYSGVLVPAALTDEECESAVLDEALTEEWNEPMPPGPAGLRAELERIAKGGPVAE